MRGRPTPTEAIEICLMLEAIFRRYGYDLRAYEPATIARRARGALASLGLRHLGELQHRVLHDVACFSALLDLLTVQVTCMFREPAFYRGLRESVIPVLRTYPRVKIWHPGCATGEEVYSTAIVLSEAGLLERSQIYATDISSSAIAEARRGRYPNIGVDQIAERYRASGGAGRVEDHLAVVDGELAIDPRLAERVTFFEHNLVSDGAPGEMNLVVCRNVLIYFQSDLARRVLDMLGDALCHRGFLCVGASESLPANLGYEPISRSGRIYRRKGTR